MLSRAGFFEQAQGWDFPSTESREALSADPSIPSNSAVRDACNNPYEDDVTRALRAAKSSRKESIMQKLCFDNHILYSLRSDNDVTFPQGYPKDHEDVSSASSEEDD